MINIYFIRQSLKHGIKISSGYFVILTENEKQNKILILKELDVWGHSVILPETETENKILILKELDVWGHSDLV